MAKILPQPGISQIELYQGGSSHIEGVSNVVKLSSNENPFGPSDAAIEAFRRSSFNLHRYPSTDHAGLRAAISSEYDLDPERLICGVGSDEIITLLCQAFAGPGDEVIHTEHGFAMYRISALAAGATPVEVPERDRHTDVDAILAACSERTRLVFLANPNNPTGTMVADQEIQRLVEGLPAHVLCVLDGAYVEYVEGFDGGAKLVEAHENVFMTRTFSKLYGLGGLRVGWGYGADFVIETLSRIRGPFNLSAPALAAAEAAVKDQAYVQKCRDENNRLRAWLAQALDAQGVPSDRSLANFILARFKSRSEAEDCDRYLKSKGLIVRGVAGYKLPNCLRISIGDEAACQRVAEAITQFKGAVS